MSGRVIKQWGRKISATQQTLSDLLKRNAEIFKLLEESEESQKLRAEKRARVEYKQRLIESSLRAARDLFRSVSQPSGQAADTATPFCSRTQCRDASGKPYWHLKNETTGEWLDVAVLRSGGGR